MNKITFAIMAIMIALFASGVVVSAYTPPEISNDDIVNRHIPDNAIEPTREVTPDWLIDYIVKREMPPNTTEPVYVSNFWSFLEEHPNLSVREAMQLYEDSR